MAAAAAAAAAAVVAAAIVAFSAILCTRLDLAAPLGFLCKAFLGHRFSPVRDFHVRVVTRSTIDICQRTKTRSNIRAVWHLDEFVVQNARALRHVHLHVFPTDSAVPVSLFSETVFSSVIISYKAPQCGHLKVSVIG
jgi:hypothetical protein